TSSSCATGNIPSPISWRSCGVGTTEWSTTRYGPSSHASPPSGAWSSAMDRPYSLLAELTYRCPLACPYCSNPLKLRLDEKELDTRTWKRVLSEGAELGVIQVHFSGGEPLVRAVLAEGIGDARGEVLYPHPITSGMGADERRLPELRDAGLDALQISL